MEEEVRRKFDTIAEQRAEMVGGLAAVEGSVNTLCATVSAYIETSKTEIKALFAKSREQANKVENIRVDYVPKHDFEAHKKESREDLQEVEKVARGKFAAMDERISSLAWKVASASGAVSLLITIIGLAVKYFK